MALSRARRRGFLIFLFGLLSLLGLKLWDRVEHQRAAAERQRLELEFRAEERRGEEELARLKLIMEERSSELREQEQKGGSPQNPAAGDFPFPKQRPVVDPSKVPTDETRP